MRTIDMKTFAIGFFFSMLIVFAFEVQAGERPKAEPQQQAQGQLQGQAQGQAQLQGQGQAQGQKAIAKGGSAKAKGGSAKQGQKQQQQAEANNAGNSQTLNQNYAETDKLELENVPDVYAPPATPTAPCRIGGSAGGSVVGAGLSFGGSKMDWECNARATADSFARHGVPAVGLMLLCKTKAITDPKNGAGMTPEECEALVAEFQQPPEQAATKNDVRKAVGDINDNTTAAMGNVREAQERQFQAAILK